jgi:hypothetical protein
MGRIVQQSATGLKHPSQMAFRWISDQLKAIDVAQMLNEK